MYFFTDDAVIHNPHLMILGLGQGDFYLAAVYGKYETPLLIAPFENCQKCLHDIQDLMQRGVTIIPKDFYTPYKVQANER